MSRAKLKSPAGPVCLYPRLLSKRRGGRRRKVKNRGAWERNQNVKSRKKEAKKMKVTLQNQGERVQLNIPFIPYHPSSHRCIESLHFNRTKREAGTTENAHESLQSFVNKGINHPFINSPPARIEPTLSTSIKSNDCFSPPSPLQLRVPRHFPISPSTFPPSSFPLSTPSTQLVDRRMETGKKRGAPRTFFVCFFLALFARLCVQEKENISLSSLKDVNARHLG
mmetsp:Transcript_53777/g.105172  ORF Transcript_53777/g.105172 Transcript_53777/m.105172 type:complete len:224 (+) Transcript_53777:683-1354(+)